MFTGQGMEKKCNIKILEKTTITRHQFNKQPVLFKRFYFWQSTAVSLVRDIGNAVMQGGGVRLVMGNYGQSYIKAGFGLHVG